MIYQAFPGWNDKLPKAFRAKRQRLFEFVHALAEDYLGQALSTTKRHFYYKAAAAGVVEKDSGGAHKNSELVSAVIQMGLVNGLLPWPVFTDEGRSITWPRDWESARRFLTSVIRQFRLPLWDSQPERVIVLVEKDALLGVIAAPCERWRVPYGAGRGDAGDVFLKRDVFDPFVCEAHDHKQPLVILILTDCNPSGWTMERVLRRKLKAYTDVYGPAYAPVDGQVVRVALTKEQIDAHGFTDLGEPLAPHDTKLAASGYPFDEQWDLDALPPDVLQGIVTKAILDHCDQAAWDQALAWEEQEAAELQQLLREEPGER